MKKLEVVSAHKNGIVIYRTGAVNFTSIPYHYTEESNQQVRKVNKTRVYREFNSQQQMLYKHVVYGLSSFHTEELEHMTKRAKKEVQAVHHKAQTVITAFKNKKTNEMIKSLMKSWFPKSSLAKDFASDKHSDHTLHNTLPFKTLGIDKYMIAQVLVTESLLPENFFTL